MSKRKKKRASEPDGYCPLAWWRVGADGLKIGTMEVSPPVRAREQAELNAIAATEDIKDATVITMIGMGKGYLAEAVRRHTKPNVDVMVYDPFPSITDEVLNADLEGVHIITTPKQLTDYYLHKATHGGLMIGTIDRPAYGNLAMFERNLLKWAHDRLANNDMMDMRKQVISERAINVTANLWRHGWITDLAHVANDRPIVIVAQGPGLSLEGVEYAQRKGAIIMCAVQAVKMLNEAGITPDFACLTDPMPAVSRQLEGYEPKFGALLVDTMTDPWVAKRWPDKLYYYHLRSAHLQHIAWSRLGLPQLHEPWATVGENMQALAVMMGAKMIITTGIDYADHRRERAGAGLGERWPLRALDGSTWWTNPHYFVGAKWSAWFARSHERRSGLRYYRFSAGMPLDLHPLHELAPDSMTSMCSILIDERPRFEAPAPIMHQEAKRTLADVLHEAARLEQGAYRVSRQVVYDRKTAEGLSKEIGVEIETLAPPITPSPKITKECPDMAALPQPRRHEIATLADELLQEDNRDANLLTTLPGVRT